MSPAPTLLERFLSGDFRALSRLLRLVEDGHPDSGAILAALYPRAGNSYRVGITGAPGAGKSTLVSRLAALQAAAGHSVAVLAVDPTSPFSGGALLGDRVRFDHPASAPGQLPAFFRSVATRGHTGGLARGTEAMAVLLEAFGYARLLIETVGVGQVGLDIAEAADTVVVVLVPESGDDVQAHKAGLLEIADVLVVNKMDRPAARDLQQQVQEGVRHRARRRLPDWLPPVIATQALTGEGLAELQAQIEAHRQALLAAQGSQGMRKARVRQVVLNLVRDELQTAAGEWLAQGLLPDGQPLEPRLEAVLRGQQDPFALARETVRHLLRASGKSG